MYQMHDALSGQICLRARYLQQQQTSMTKESTSPSLDMNQGEDG